MEANTQSFFQQSLLAGYTKFNIFLTLDANTYVLSICKKNCSWISSLKKHALIFLRLKSIALRISTNLDGYKKLLLRYFSLNDFEDCLYNTYGYVCQKKIHFYYLNETMQFFHFNHFTGVRFSLIFMLQCIVKKSIFLRPFLFALIDFCETLPKVAF